MRRQQPILQNVKPIAAVALVGLGLAFLLRKLGGPAAQVDSILSCVARDAMGLLPYIVPAAWRALQSYVFDYQGFSPCHLQMLVSCRSLLQVVAGAA